VSEKIRKPNYLVNPELSQVVKKKEDRSKKLWKSSSAPIEKGSKGTNKKNMEFNTGKEEKPRSEGRKVEAD